MLQNARLEFSGSSRASAAARSGGPVEGGPAGGSGGFPGQGCRTGGGSCGGVRRKGGPV